MTKLEKLFNDYYSTEDLTIRQHINELKEELSSLEITDELYNFLYWLNNKLEEKSS